MERAMTFTPENAQVVREAYLLAQKTFQRKLSKSESTVLAKAVIAIAATGCMDVQKLATRAVIRLL